MHSARIIIEQRTFHCKPRHDEDLETRDGDVASATSIHDA